MTPEEAIEIIWERHMDCEDYRFQFDDYPDGYDFEFDQAILMAAQALEEIQQYREIGTVEECREAVEKQKAKKIVYESESVFSNGFSHYRMGKCPMCNKYYNSNDEVKYCPKCGSQTLSFRGDGTAVCSDCGFVFGVVECEEDE